MTEMHDAAFRAGVWSVIAARAKELADMAKAELQALEVGDTVAGRYQGQTVAKATKTKGREKIVVTDEAALLEWVKEHAPTEVVEAVNPAFLKTFGHVDGQVHWQGHPVDFMAVVEGDPYITIRKQPDAPFIVAQLLSSGQLSLEGPRDWQAEVESGAIG